MKKISHLIEQIVPYTRPNSFISYLDNLLAILFFLLLRKIKWLTPNILTSFSLSVWLLGILGFMVWGWKLIFIFLILISYTFDNIDGIWARYFGQASNFGAWYDSVCDRIKDVLILLVFIFVFRDKCYFIFLLLALLLLQMSFVVEFYAGQFLKRRFFSKENAGPCVKRFRFKAFGPAEANMLYSLIILLPDFYKTIPILIFNLALFLIIIRSLRSYEFK